MVTVIVPVITAGLVPPARMGHSAVLLDATLVIFGGRISPAQPLNDVWVCDIPTGTWQSIECKGQGPAARFRHTAVAMGCHLQVCCLLNPAHSLPLQTAAYTSADSPDRSGSQRNTQHSSVQSKTDIHHIHYIHILHCNSGVIARAGER